MRYLMVLPVPAYPTGPGRFAIADGFGEHLRLLRRMMEGRISLLVLASPSMTAADYEKSKGAMVELDIERDGIAFRALFGAGSGRARFLVRDFPSAACRLWSEVRRSDLVHAGTSHNLWRPIEFPALMMGVLFRKKTVSVNDIDHRNDARMNLRTGVWSRREYLTNRYVFDPIRSMQIRIAARVCTLVLLKGRKFAEDYGRGRPNVRDFLDSAFTSSQIIDPAAMQGKIESMRNSGEPLRLVYFGRLVPYKGIDLCLEAIARARDQGAGAMLFEVIGSGAEAERLKQRAEELRLNGIVRFRGQIPFGPALFGELHRSHVLLATPRGEDTPRSALDAFAAGVPVLAFDTYYYRDLRSSGAVAVEPWMSVERIAARLVEWSKDRSELCEMAHKAVEFAHDNTQEKWLERRIAWTFRDVGGGAARGPG